jgi:hypothetical protein
VRKGARIIALLLPSDARHEETSGIVASLVWTIIHADWVDHSIARQACPIQRLLSWMGKRSQLGYLLVHPLQSDSRLVDNGVSMKGVL